MKQRNITVTIVPDRRRIKDDVAYPLNSHVTYKRNRKYYASGYNASLKECSQMNWVDLYTKAFVEEVYKSTDRWLDLVLNFFLNLQRFKNRTN